VGGITGPCHRGIVSYSGSSADGSTVRHDRPAEEETSDLCSE